jgi:hypothetical protein
VSRFALLSFDLVASGTSAVYNTAGAICSVHFSSDVEDDSDTIVSAAAAQRQPLRRKEVVAVLTWSHYRDIKRGSAATAGAASGDIGSRGDAVGDSGELTGSSESEPEPDMDVVALMNAGRGCLMSPTPSDRAAAAATALPQLSLRVSDGSGGHRATMEAQAHPRRLKLRSLTSRLRRQLAAATGTDRGLDAKRSGLSAERTSASHCQTGSELAPESALVHAGSTAARSTRQHASRRRTVSVVDARERAAEPGGGTDTDDECVGEDERERASRVSVPFSSACHSSVSTFESIGPDDAPTDELHGESNIQRSSARASARVKPADSVPASASAMACH